MNFHNKTLNTFLSLSKAEDDVGSGFVRFNYQSCYRISRCSFFVKMHGSKLTLKNREYILVFVTGGAVEICIYVN